MGISLLFAFSFEYVPYIEVLNCIIKLFIVCHKNFSLSLSVSGIGVPNSFILSYFEFNYNSISFASSGKNDLIWENNTSVSLFVKLSVPTKPFGKLE